ncbi:MAG: B12-binding domain-containing radical SAM protein, partial [Firmicutes bacterium]|nr:B12-binding domain-containing radical SAM protein [Bacillota bacterium]
PFLEDLEKGTARHIYTTTEHPSLDRTPIPLWDLIDLRDYATMNLQFSRGCPYDCEFCDITALFGHKPRLKTAAQVLGELDALYECGWRGGVFIVDDNFIGNKAYLKREILPAMISWMERHRNPFWYITEASINLADDEELMLLMQEAGFTSVFVGIETPDEGSLKECNKYHNVNRDMIACVKKIQNYGMQVSGGFIVGFDNDTPSIFERQINFIQRSGIVTAMVGLLQAPVGTKLFKRLKKEKRLLPNPSFSGSNTDLSTNFIPKMNMQKLVEGYQKIVTTIYEPKHYYARVLEFFKEFKPAYKRGVSSLRFCYAKALFRAMYVLGIKEKGRRYYWNLLFQTLVKYPRFLPEAIAFAIYGHHFRKVFNCDR